MDHKKKCRMLLHPLRYLFARGLLSFFAGFAAGALAAGAAGHNGSALITAAAETGAFFFLTAGYLMGMIRILKS